MTYIVLVNGRLETCTCNVATNFFLFSISSATNSIIHAKDHASIQLSLAEVDPTTGIVTGTVKQFAICGGVRKMGESDDCIVRLAKKEGIVSS